MGARGGLAFAAVCAIGCSSSQTLPNYASESDCSAFADRMVATIAQCRIPADVAPADLHARFVERCTLEANAPGTGVTADSLAACGDALASSCKPYGACPPVYGWLPEGAPCGRNSQCASEYCAFANDGLGSSDGAAAGFAKGCGECAAPTTMMAAAGITCGSKTCSAGSYCGEGGPPAYDPQTCVAYALEGEVCVYAAGSVQGSFNRACAPGLQCQVQTSTSDYSTSVCVGVSTSAGYVAPTDPSACTCPPPEMAQAVCR